MDSNSHHKKKNSQLAWSFVVFALSLLLSITFGVASEFAMQKADIFVALVIIIVFMAIAIVSDMVGVAIAGVQKEPFHAMASRKVRGAKEALKLIDNASKVASVASDVIGDVCGILSGAAAASIALMVQTGSDIANVFIGAGCSAIVASLTIFGKSVFKKYAIDNSVKIILIWGKVMSAFSGNENKAKKEKQNKNIAKQSLQNGGESGDKNLHQTVVQEKSPETKPNSTK